MLRARAARDCARRHARAHRHGRGELVFDLGLDSFHLSLVQPLGLRVGGRHLVLWHHLHWFRADSPPGQGEGGADASRFAVGLNDRVTERTATSVTSFLEGRLFVCTLFFACGFLHQQQHPPSVGRLKPTADAHNVVGPTWVR